jgi:hypothetical protein
MVPGSPGAGSGVASPVPREQGSVHSEALKAEDLEPEAAATGAEEAEHRREAELSAFAGAPHPPLCSAEAGVVDGDSMRGDGGGGAPQPAADSFDQGDLRLHTEARPEEVRRLSQERLKRQLVQDIVVARNMLFETIASRPM